jgi:regulator of protease activity HflC (stomatin/prohibitin superfamily)
MKAPPTSYLIEFKNGKPVREGAGLSFFYYAPTSTIVLVPMGSVDVPFAFEETSADFQLLSVQGQLTYRVVDAKRVATLLDFSINSYGRYASDDPEKLSDRLVSTTQALTSSIVHRLPLRTILTTQQQIGEEVLAALRASDAVTLLGVEVMSLSILSIKPSPDTAKALEAEAREQLLRQQDEAIYARRNAAVEQERLIKETELNTELAVQEKQRQIQEKKMQADIANEQQRAELIGTQVENDRKQADARGYAIEASLKPLRGTDWRVLMAANATKIDPRTNAAMAFQELAENAGKIGELNITSELFASLVKPPGK